jgi:hypothetical protein
VNITLKININTIIVPCLELQHNNTVTLVIFDLRRDSSYLRSSFLRNLEPRSVTSHQAARL